MLSFYDDDMYLQITKDTLSQGNQEGKVLYTEELNNKMKKILTLFIILLSIAYSCSDAEAKESKSKSNVFENIDKKDQKLFTQQRENKFLQ